MTMNVLLVEDSGSAGEQLKGTITREGHRVCDAFNIFEASHYWETEKVDCIIIDLNMDPAGLSDEQKKHTANGLLTGWIWVESLVYGKHPGMRPRTIILTEYERELREKIAAARLANVRIIPKRGAQNQMDVVLENLRAIELQYGRRNTDEQPKPSKSS